jgi:hypothetical protein
MTENLAANGSGIEDVAKIYRDGTYLKNNETWHVEDSPWKAKHIATILQNNNINHVAFVKLAAKPERY